ncbi:MAG: ABC-2 transporter permease [Oscillospiraceae bacterium]
MKGLLLKDWYVAARSCRLHLAVILAMTIITILTDVGFMYLMYPILFAGIIPVYIQSVEEKWGWGGYVQTMPVTRRTVVSEKYIATLIAVAGSILLLAAAWAIRCAMTDAAWRNTAPQFLILLCFGLVFPSVILPAMFRFGVEKGRVITLIVFAVGWAAVFAVAGNFEGEAGSPELIGRLVGILPVLAAAVAGLFALSWFVSVKLYETREL